VAADECYELRFGRIFIHGHASFQVREQAIQFDADVLMKVRTDSADRSRTEYNPAVPVSLR
jgi:hypothetical protein